MEILIAEDEETSRTMLEEILTEWGHTVTSCCDGDQAWAAFRETDAPQLALLDLMMPGMDGLTLCREVRGRKRRDPPYLIMVSARDKREDTIRGLDAGANDYITKPYDVGELQARINVGRRMIELQNELRERGENLKKANEELRLLSLTDPLTGAYNPDYLSDWLPHDVKRSMQYNHPLSIVLCDIDDFKKVNEDFGHLTGDRVLIEFVKCISGAIRKDVDWVVRYGGEEFMIILPETDCESARIFSEKLRDKISHTVTKVKGKKVRITASFGVTGFGGDTPDVEISPEGMIALAEACLSQAQGREGGGIQAKRMG
jgi:diguanylate cyclase (GGDEF)-like protein